MRFLVVCMRLPFAVISTAVIAIFYLIWLAIETPVALVLFPLCAVVKNARWLQTHWPGTFPVALRRFLSLTPPEYQEKPASFWTQLFGGHKTEVVRTKEGGGMNTILRCWRWAFSPSEALDESEAET